MRFAPRNRVVVMNGPDPRPAKEDHDEDSSPKGLPAMEGTGRHRLRLRVPGLRGEAFHLPVAPNEKGNPREEEDEEEEPVGHVEIEGPPLVVLKAEGRSWHVSLARGLLRHVKAGRKRDALLIQQYRALSLHMSKRDARWWARP